ncbi:NAD(P)H-dependent flavin oxidoreductase [Actinokineospora fastidiosa]|uniref:Propionate 3-nitronate monooxygenase n=1 Tax=Actinokineospora fastidiosa TaxID=1816 RepID=A0A918L6P0_9PSEU|nr:nitronate monooxygenase [Actinokineospora fastidiosa]GGS12606.1 oxidoreductase [Actinokineospora fastidiosa]
MRLEAVLGIDVPVVQGPFGGDLSTVALAAAVSSAGGLGSYGAHLLAPERITALVAELRAATARPFAVNLWVPQPDEDVLPTEEDVARVRPYLRELGLPDPDTTGPLLPDFDAQLDALLAAAPPVISFVMGLPPAAAVAEARARGIVTIGTATTPAEAVAVEAAGLDVVVASGSDAGGHRGAFLRPVAESLVGTFSLVPQVVDAVGIPVIAAGGIADARGVAAARALGADGVQVGTGFLATAESGASAAHKAALHGPGAEVTVLTRAFTGRTARAQLNRLVAELADAPVPPYPAQSALLLDLRRAAGAAGDADLINLWSGQAAALTAPRTAREYLELLTG